MNPLYALRKHVFKASQKEMAAIANTSQATVSRWETGELIPDLSQLDRIRSEAASRGLEWNDAWLFEGAPAASSEGTNIAAE